MNKNIHINIIVVLAVAALAASFYLGSSIKEKEMGRSEVITDSARDAAYITYDKVHKQQLMDDPDYAELYEYNQELEDVIAGLLDSIDTLNKELGR